VTDNAKTQKVSPCNAAESLLVHAAQAAAFLPPSATCSPPRAWRCAAARARPRCWPPGPGWCRPPRPTGPRSTWTHHQHQGRRLAGRGHRAHQPLRLAPHRRHPDHAPPERDALPARGGFGQRDGQRQHPLRRRLRIRPGRRDRHQHRQVPRPRAGGAGRTDLAEVGGAGPGRDAAASHAGHEHGPVDQPGPGGGAGVLDGGRLQPTGGAAHRHRRCLPPGRRTGATPRRGGHRAGGHLRGTPCPASSPRWTPGWRRSHVAPGRRRLAATSGDGHPERCADEQRSPAGRCRRA
jgi:hypothetical protein